MTAKLTLMEHIVVKVASELELEARWHIFAKRTEATEDKFKPKVRAAFTKQEKAVFRAMKGKPVPDTSDAEKTAQVGDDVVYKGRICEIIKIPDNYPIITIRWESDHPEWESAVTAVPPSDIVLLKASDEAEAAAETYVDGVFKPATWQVPFQTLALPFVTEAFMEAGAAAFDEVGIEAAFNVTNARAKKILEERVFKFAKEVNETTQKRLRVALAKGFDAGESIPELSKRVADVFEISRGSITDRIARTEIVGASNQGTFQGYVESDVVDTKVWIDSRDARVRTDPHNHRIDGQERKLQAKFSNGLKHPHDPDGEAGNVINCRCSHMAGKLKEAA